MNLKNTLSGITVFTVLMYGNFEGYLEKLEARQKLHLCHILQDY